MRNLLLLFLLLLVLYSATGFTFYPSSFPSQHQHQHRHHHQAVPIRRCCRLPLSSLAAARTQTHALEGDGVPSNLGWKSDRLNRLTEWADSKTPNRPIIKEYKPRGLWLWTRWKGTVLRLIWRSVLVSLLLTAAIDYWARSTSKTTWSVLSVPPASEQLIQSLSGLEKLWSYQLTFTSFILTFFTAQAYDYWKKVYNTARMIQGRINDFCMLLTMSAERKTTKTKAGTDEKTTTHDDGYSHRAERLVEKCTRLIRMSHTFFWAATPTASNGLTDCNKFLEDAANCPIPDMDDDHIGPLLLSPYGLAALVQSGQLTKAESRTLLLSGLPPSQYCNILLEWVGVYCIKGLREGIFVGSAGLEENLLRQLTQLRASMFDIDDFRAGRMPLAYVQLVQILVDSLVLLAPLALYAELGSLSIPLLGLLALFFRGLLTLSKSFLDPFGVEGYGEQTIRVDVLVSELNFGASKRWIQAGKALPPEDEEP